MNQSFTLRNIKLLNRIGVASGTFGYGDEVPDLVDVNKLGAIFTKSLSLKPRDGNPTPRITETASGMLNSIGLANIGVQNFINEKIPILQKYSCIIIANIAASSVQEYCDVVELLEPHTTVSGYEINISCPNVKEGGLNFGTNVQSVAHITKELRKRTNKPLIIKLTPNVTHISEFARAVEAEGADAVSVINTLIGMSVNIHTQRPKLSTVTGGLSGPAIKPIALAKVYEVYKAVSIPIFGIGGISTWEDAIEFFLVGATAVQVGTTNFINPATGIHIAEEIQNYCEKKSLQNIGELVGKLDVKGGVSVIESWL